MAGKQFPRVDGGGRRRRVEWPSGALCVGVYGGFLGLTYCHAQLPPVAFACLMVPLLTLQASMQHEFIHGHPTPWRGINHALGAVPLSLWLPFQSYRMSHLVHHCDEKLTDPFDDPESYYWSAGDWARIGPLGRAFVRFHTTLAGRLLFGPAWNIGRFLRAEARALRSGDPVARRIWRRHIVMAGAVLLWVVAICGIDPLFYILGIVYPSTSILLLRSFAEHRAAQGTFERTAIVENAPILGFLFLYNNLHAAHHERPLVPWYALPGWYRANRERLVAQNHGLVYDGYRDVALRFLFVPHDVSVHPDYADAGRHRAVRGARLSRSPSRLSTGSLVGLQGVPDGAPALLSKVGTADLVENGIGKPHPSLLFPGMLERKKRRLSMSRKSRGTEQGTAAS